MKFVQGFGVLALALVATVALAAVKTFRWTPPTEYDDGFPLAPEEITGYTIDCGNTTGGPYDVANVRTPGGATASFQHNMPPGTWYCTARTIVGTGANERMSARSNEVFFTVEPPNPRAPAAFSVD